jgi:hypothetical protein
VDYHCRAHGHKPNCNNFFATRIIKQNLLEISKQRLFNSRADSQRTQLGSDLRPKELVNENYLYADIPFCYLSPFFLLAITNKCLKQCSATGSWVICLKGSIQVSALS